MFLLKIFKIRHLDFKKGCESYNWQHIWNNRGLEAIHTCWCCCHHPNSDKEEELYTNDAYTLVRNHPLIIVSQQSHCPELLQNEYHINLYEKKLVHLETYYFLFHVSSMSSI